MTREEFEAIIAEINNECCNSVHEVKDKCELFSKVGKQLVNELEPERNEQ